MKLIHILYFALSLSVTLPVQAQKVLVFIHEGVEILDFTGPMEVFLQAGFEVYTVSLTQDPIMAMRALKVTPDYSVEDYPDPDIVSFYGGGGVPRKSKDEAYKPHILKMIEKADIRFSVCSGAFFLAEAGVLDGHKATTFHSMTGMLQEGYPEVEVLEDVRFVDNGNVITTAGISAGIDGALHLVAKLRGAEAAKRVATNMEYDKWVPGEGLILENPLVKAAAELGFSKAAKKHKGHPLYKGEADQLVKSFLKKEDVAQAIEVQEYLIEHSSANVGDYHTLGLLYKKAGKKTPINENDFLALVRDGEFESAKSELQKAKKEFPGWQVYRHSMLNMVGYQYLQANEPKKALAAFELNTVGYPDHWNCWDSLAEGHLKAGNEALAIKYYKKSIELNPNNSNGKEMLEKIEKGDL